MVGDEAWMATFSEISQEILLQFRSRSTDVHCLPRRVPIWFFHGGKTDLSSTVRAVEAHYSPSKGRHTTWTGSGPTWLSLELSEHLFENTDP